MYIILAILAFGFLIAIHEGGHFLAAKACGVRVNEFAIGMGPKLLKKQGKETLYTLRLLPLGGFCAMEGEDEETGDARAFSARPLWQRIIILVAGASMNFLLGFLLVLCITPHASFAEPIIYDFMDGCPYQGEAGFQIGDRIISIDGHRTYFTQDFTEYLLRDPDGAHRIVLRRNGHRIVLNDFTMQRREYVQSDGSTALRVGVFFAPKKAGFFPAVRYAWLESLSFVKLVWNSLGDLFTGAVGVRDLSGPVGIVDYVNEVETAARSPLEAYFFFFYFFALIAVNLAVMNLLPIPALDGGRVFLLLLTWLIEHITRRKLNPKYEGFLNAACLIALMALMLFVMANDIIKIFTR